MVSLSAIANGFRSFAPKTFFYIVIFTFVGYYLLNRICRYMQEIIIYYYFTLIFCFLISVSILSLIIFDLVYHKSINMLFLVPLVYFSYRIYVEFIELKEYRVSYYNLKSPKILENIKYIDTDSLKDGTIYITDQKGKKLRLFCLGFVYYRNKKYAITANEEDEEENDFWIFEIIPISTKTTHLYGIENVSLFYKILKEFISQFSVK